MRTLNRLIVLALVFAARPAVSDGFLAEKVAPGIDPRSHSRDITEPTQKAVIFHRD